MAPLSSPSPTKYPTYDPSIVSVPSCNRGLSSKTLSQIDTEFHSTATHLNYNTLAPMLELIAWMEKHKENSFRRAITDFSESPKAIIEKYHGGSSALVAAAFFEKMQEKGLQTDLVGQCNLASKQFTIPTPGKRVPEGLPLWQEAHDHLKGITHYSLAFPYTDEQDKPHITIFRKYFSSESPI